MNYQRGYLDNVPKNAEVDLAAAQQELAHVLDDFVELAPVDKSAQAYNKIGREPRSYSLLGSGLLRVSSRGYFENWTRFGVIRTKETKRLLGQAVGPPQTHYAATWSDDVTNSGYSPSDHEGIAFTLGTPEGATIDTYNRMTQLADNALGEVKKSPPRRLPLTVDYVLKGLEKPDGVRDELWSYGTSTAFDALYFMQRPSAPSARGARYIVDQTFVPETPDQVADIAILNTLKVVDLQHRREQIIDARMRGEN